jgi:hypothetical protein
MNELLSIVNKLLNITKQLLDSAIQLLLFRINRYTIDAFLVSEKIVDAPALLLLKHKFDGMKSIVLPVKSIFKSN